MRTWYPIIGDDLCLAVNPKDVKPSLNLDLAAADLVHFSQDLDRGREPRLRVSQSRGSRGVDAQATWRLTTRGRVRLGLLQNHVVIGFFGVNPRQ